MRSEQARVRSLTAERQKRYILLKRELQHSSSLAKGESSFMGYVNHMWPQFIEGRHHRVMADAFDRIIDGSLKRLIINLGPRHTKSEFGSFHLPAKYLGHYPDRKIMQLSHNADLATDFGRRVRDAVGSAEYQEIFPGTTLKPDTKAAGRWNTSKGGVYVAMGIHGRLAGKGADLLIIDDPHSEQEYIRALSGDTSPFDQAFEWYQTGPRQRLQPGAAIVLIMTRWHTRDMTGRLIKRMTSQGGIDSWEIIEFPAFMPPESTNPLWPEFWSEAELLATRAELTAQQWNAQYLQNPTSEEGALVKREWWQIWPHEHPPDCDFIIQTWDTAFTAKSSADYSACTTWGVFYLPDDDEQQRANIILLDAYHKRLEFPDLKRVAYQMWKDRSPDAFIIEAKASGLPLIYELRQMGIPVQDFTPVRGTKANPNDKIARVNGITDLFASGMVWRPDTRWAEDVVEEFASFPVGDHDDYVDAGTIALTRFRQGGFITLDTDFEDDPPGLRMRGDYY